MSAESAELLAQAKARLVEVVELARCSFPREYKLTIHPLFEQVRAALEALPGDHAHGLAIERVRAALDSLHDLDALLEAYSLCAAAARR